MRRLAVRCRKANGQWAVAGLISTLYPAEVLALTQPTPVSCSDPESVRLSNGYFSDQRGGGVETSFKGDQQGLGSTKRNKKRFDAQQMVIVLGSLAQHVVIWARGCLTQEVAPCKLQHYGIKHMVRDVFHVSGFLIFDASGQLGHIVLNQAAPLAALFADALSGLLTAAHVGMSVGQTSVLKRQCSRGEVRREVVDPG